MMPGAPGTLARSMPRVFDSLLNCIPFMNYPKWVDMDLVLFPTSMDPQYQLKSNFELNFHGKIKWTPALFGEAGFGIKNYSFKLADNDLDVDFYSFYGTAGLGLSF